MSLLRQLFRQKIGKDYPEDLDDILFHMLAKEKHPPVQLLEDISLLWFTLELITHHRVLCLNV